MGNVTKTIKYIDEHALKIIEAHAKQENVTGSQLIREQIEDYAKRLQEDSAAKTLHTYLDELIAANNNLVRAQNDNTLVLGELAKEIISRLDFYLPPLANDIEQIQNGARPQEKNLPNTIHSDEFE